MYIYILLCVYIHNTQQKHKHIFTPEQPNAPPHGIFVAGQDVRVAFCFRLGLKSESEPFRFIFPSRQSTCLPRLGLRYKCADGWTPYCGLQKNAPQQSLSPGCPPQTSSSSTCPAFNQRAPPFDILDAIMQRWPHVAGYTRKECPPTVIIARVPPSIVIIAIVHRIQSI